MQWKPYSQVPNKDATGRRASRSSSICFFSIALNLILAVGLLLFYLPGFFRTPPETVTEQITEPLTVSTQPEVAATTAPKSASHGAPKNSCKRRCSMCADDSDCCSIGDHRRTVFLAILCKSAPDNMKKRQASRTVWDQMVRVDHFYADFVLPRQMFFAFVVGQSGVSRVDEAVDGESRLYRDMLIGNFVDTSKNQTAKLLWSLRWLRGNLRFSYLLMADDSAFVNFFTLIQWLVISPARKLYAGRLESNVLVVRDPESKWYVDRALYAPETYPPYHQGFGYVLSCDLADDALGYVEGIPLFGIDDSLMGMLMYVAGVKAVNNPRFHAAPHYCQVNEDPHPLVIGNADADNFIRYMKDVLYIGCPVCKGKEGSWPNKGRRRPIRRGRH